MMKILPVVAAIVLVSYRVAAFTTPARQSKRTPQDVLKPITTRRNKRLPPLQAAITGGKKVAKTTIAGRMLPFIKKFYITPAKAKDIVANVYRMTDAVDIILPTFLAFALHPLVKLSYDRLPEERKEAKPFKDTRRFWISKFSTKAAKVALSAYAVDMGCVVLTTLGFTFPNKWGLANAYAKVAYTVWIVTEVLKLKTKALCKLFKVQPDDMGRADIFDQVLNGIIVALVSLVLFDWLSIEMGMAVRGVFAFGSVGTLAFTLASQGLVKQFLSGLVLIFSNKMYVGDNVSFGGGISGTVMKVGFMETILRNSDNTITRVPNSVLADQSISNISRVRQSQVKQTLRFHYEDAEKIPDILEAIKEEIQKSCPKVITDGRRPFRVIWTDYREDYLEVMVNTHHDIAPTGNEYWENRQKVLMAIHRAVKRFNVEFAQLYSFSPSSIGPEWRITPRKVLAFPEDGQEDAAKKDGTSTSVDGEKSSS